MRPATVSRRAVLATGAALLGAAAIGRTQPAPRPRTRLVLLGTAGGPTPKLERAAPAQAIVIDDRVYLVDCGDGVARQLTLAHLALSRLKTIFITHQHSDHNAGYGALLLVSWASVPSTVDVYGPPPLATMTRLLLEANAFDIETRIADEGREPLAPMVRTHEVTAPGEVFRDDLVRVTAAINRHPPIQHSFAYRFDGPDRSIVISGDTNYSDAVIALAKGADVLVHEALYRPFWERPGAPQPPAVIRHIVASHTDAEDVGRVAQAAGVKTLVLTHFVPSDPPDAVTEEQWTTAAKKHFSGRVVVGRDLVEI